LKIPGVLEVFPLDDTVLTWSTCILDQTGFLKA